MAHDKKTYAEDGRLRGFNKLRKAGKYMIIGGIVSFVIGVILLMLAEELVWWWMEDIVFVFFMFGGIAAAVLGLAIRSLIGHVAKKVAVNYTPEALREVLDRLDSYRHGAGINDSYICSSSAGLPFYDEISGKKDYVKGVLRGIPVEFSEFSLIKEEEERDEDGEIKVTRTKVFSGTLVVLKHGLELRQDITITQISKNLFGGIKTESEKFNKRFSIKCGDGHDVFYLLTPHYMEKLNGLSDSYGKIFCITFLTGGDLILILSGRNYFEADGVSSVSELVQKIRNEMNELGDIIDRLLIPEKDAARHMTDPAGGYGATTM